MGSHLTAAATGTAVATAMPPVLADAAAAAVLAVSGCAAARACRGRRGRTLCLHLLRSRPCSQRQTGTTALLAPAAPTPVLADAATTAVLAVAALPPVLAHTHAAAIALLALAALPAVLAEVTTAHSLHRGFRPPMRTGHT